MRGVWGSSPLAPPPPNFSAYGSPDNCLVYKVIIAHGCMATITNNIYRAEIDDHFQIHCCMGCEWYAVV